jgi:hypothetical protein
MMKAHMVLFEKVCGNLYQFHRLSALAAVVFAVVVPAAVLVVMVLDHSLPVSACLHPIDHICLNYITLLSRSMVNYIYNNYIVLMLVIVH